MKELIYMSGKLVEVLKIFWRNLSLQNHTVIVLRGRGNCGIMKLREKKEGIISEACQLQPEFVF